MLIRTVIVSQFAVVVIGRGAEVSAVPWYNPGGLASCSAGSGPRLGELVHLSSVLSPAGGWTRARQDKQNAIPFTSVSCRLLEKRMTHPGSEQ